MLPVWVLVGAGFAAVLAGCYTISEAAATVGWFVIGVVCLLWAAARAAPERGSGGRS